MMKQEGLVPTVVRESVSKLVRHAIIVQRGSAKSEANAYTHHIIFMNE